MTKFMQILLASFGVMALMLAGCTTTSTEEETMEDTSSMEDDSMTVEATTTDGETMEMEVETEEAAH